MITTIAHTTDTRLILPPDLRGQVGLSDGSRDEALGLHIEQTSTAFSGELERDPWLQTYEEQISGRGGGALTLSRWPIVEVESVSHRGQAVGDWQLIGDQRRDTLYRAKGWRRGQYIPGAFSSSGDTELNYTVRYRAGWVPPGLVITWATDISVTVSTWARVSPIAGLLFEAVVGGVTGSLEPVWPTAEGTDCVDGEVTWRALPAREVPADLKLAAILHAGQIYKGYLDVPFGVSLQADELGSTSYATSSALLRGHRAVPFSPAVISILDSYR